MADIRASQAVLEKLRSLGLEQTDIDTALRLASAIAAFESNSNPVARQALDNGGVGVGSGMYQYEPPSAKSAVSRARRVLGEDTEWLNKLETNNFDIVKAETSAQNQTDLFLLDHLLAGDTNFIETVRDNTPANWFEYWGRYHKRADTTDKEQQRWNKSILPNFQKGGTAMAHKQVPEETNAQMEQIGLIQEPRDVDPVSGNEIPLGSTAEGVRDDEVAAVSPGEFVVPEYAVNFHGLKFYMQSLAVAKDGLDQMKQMGMTGQPDKATISDDTALPTMNSVNGQQDNGSEVSPEFQTGGPVPDSEQEGTRLGQFRISENTAGLIQGFYKEVREDESDFDIAGALDVAKIIAKFENEALDPRVHQLGGTAKGLFQYEPDAVETAVQRINDRFGVAAPDWAKNLTDNDASKLTSEQQTELFVLDQLLQKQVGYMPFSSLVSNLSSQHSEDVYDYWREEHQKGPSLLEAKNPKTRSRIRKNRIRWEGLFGGFGDKNGDTVAEFIRVPTEDTFAKGGPIFSEPIPTAMFQSGGLVPPTVPPLTVPAMQTVQAPLVAPVAPLVAPPVAPLVAPPVAPPVAQVPVTRDLYAQPIRPVTTPPPQVTAGQPTPPYPEQVGHPIVCFTHKLNKDTYCQPQVGPFPPQPREGYAPADGAPPPTTTPTVDDTTVLPEEEDEEYTNEMQAADEAAAALEALEPFMTDSGTPANLSEGWTARPAAITDETLKAMEASLSSVTTPSRGESAAAQGIGAVSSLVVPPAGAAIGLGISKGQENQKLWEQRDEILAAQRSGNVPGVGVWTNPLSADAHSYTFLATGQGTVPRAQEFLGQPRSLRYTVFDSNKPGRPVKMQNVLTQMALAHGYDPRITQNDIQFNQQGNLVINDKKRLYTGVHIPKRVDPVSGNEIRGRIKDAYGLTKAGQMIILDDDGTFKSMRISEKIFTGLTADTMLDMMADGAAGVGERRLLRSDAFIDEAWTFAARRSDDSDKPVTVGEVQEIIQGAAPEARRGLLAEAGIIIDDDDDDDGKGEGERVGDAPANIFGAGEAGGAQEYQSETYRAEQRAFDEDDLAKGGLVKKRTRSSSKKNKGKGLAKRK